MHYDLICLGGGSGGIATARRAAEYGAKVALIEANSLGGTCVNMGCVPKKLFWYAVGAKEIIDSAQLFPFQNSEQALLNWSEFKKNRDDYIKRLNNIYQENLLKSGIDLFTGFGRFVATNQIEVNGEILSASHIVIATGGRPEIPQIEGAEFGQTSDDFFKLEQQPQKALIVGSGYIACETASVLSALGTKVDLIVRGKRLLKQIDSEVSDLLAENLREQGVNIHFSAQISHISGAKNKPVLHFANGEALQGDFLMWAIGRQANTDKINLSVAGVNTAKNGNIEVDLFQNTNVDGIYALGDIANEPTLTPVAISAGRKLATRLFRNQALYFDKSFAPSVIFTHPPIAFLGENEETAREKFGEKIKIYRAKFTPMSRLFAQHKYKTLMKLICYGESEQIIGMQMIGDGADEMLQGFAVAVKMGATKADFDATLAIHPTAAEEWVTMR